MTIVLTLFTAILLGGFLAALAASKITESIRRRNRANREADMLQALSASAQWNVKSRRFTR